MAIAPEEFKLICEFIHEHSGIVIGPGKEYLVENRLTTILVQNGCENFYQLYDKLKVDSGPLRTKIIDAMTTNETLWFRDDSFFFALSDTIVPWLIDRAGRKPTVRIWSAACSTGQEPYSIAMLLLDALDKMSTSKAITATRFQIMATDLSPSALFIAKQGRYSQLAISRGMKKNFLEKFFKQQGLAYEIDQTVRNMVEFRQFNLKESFGALGQFDFVMCRNVLIYFDDQMKKQIYAKMLSILESEGLMAIGASESPRGYSEQFEQVLMGTAALYRPKNAGGRFTVQFPIRNQTASNSGGV